MIKGLFFAVVIFLVGTFPATWLLMLFLGNVRANVSYWGALPLGALVSVLLGGRPPVRVAGAHRGVRTLVAELKTNEERRAADARRGSSAAVFARGLGPPAHRPDPVPCSRTAPGRACPNSCRSG